MSKKKGYHNRKFAKNNQTNPVLGEQAGTILSNLGEDNRVIKMFRDISKELDDKHDRYERLVKLSRDITIESKRIIFSLHGTSTDMEDKKQTVFEEVNTRLQNLVSNNFKQIALELKGYDPYLYHRAFTSGMQEFIEALAFYQYLKNGRIEPWENIQKKFIYQGENEDSVELFFSQFDYILGIADFTGELMRRCINNLGIGNIEDCFKLCDCVKFINRGFISTNTSGHKEISRKMYTLRQSLAKMELVCYNLKIRGSEIPKCMLAAVLESHQEPNEDDDEGYY